MQAFRSVTLFATFLLVSACTHAPSPGRDELEAIEPTPSMAAQLATVEQGKAFAAAGWNAIRLEDYIRAREMFALAAGLNPDKGENWILLAQLEHQLGNHEAATVALARYTSG